MEAKRKISVTLDADLLAELEQGEGGVSAQLNDALRAEIRRRRQAAGWQAVLDELLDDDGPLDTPEDLAAMARMEEQWRELDRAAERRATPSGTTPRRRAS